MSGTNSTACSTCVCALLTAFSPALRAAGISYDATTPKSFPLDKASAVLRACTEQYLVAMMQADIELQTLSAVSDCRFTSEGDAPACFVQAVAGLASNSSSMALPGSAVSATDRIGTDGDNLACEF